jgi:hypothetical protein
MQTFSFENLRLYYKNSSDNLVESTLLEDVNISRLSYESCFGFLKFLETREHLLTTLVHAIKSGRYAAERAVQAQTTFLTATVGLVETFREALLRAGDSLSSSTTIPSTLLEPLKTFRDAYSTFYRSLQASAEAHEQDENFLPEGNLFIHPSVILGSALVEPIEESALDSLTQLYNKFCTTTPATEGLRQALEVVKEMTDNTSPDPLLDNLLFLVSFQDFPAKALEVYNVVVDIEATAPSVLSTDVMSSLQADLDRIKGWSTAQFVNLSKYNDKLRETCIQILQRQVQTITGLTFDNNPSLSLSRLADLSLVGYKEIRQDLLNAHMFALRKKLLTYAESKLNSGPLGLLSSCVNQTPPQIIPLTYPPQPVYGVLSRQAVPGAIYLSNGDLESSVYQVVAQRPAAIVSTKVAPLSHAARVISDAKIPHFTHADTSTIAASHLDHQGYLSVDPVRGLQFQQSDTSPEAVATVSSPLQQDRPIPLKSKGTRLSDVRNWLQEAKPTFKTVVPPFIVVKDGESLPSHNLRYPLIARSSSPEEDQRGRSLAGLFYSSNSISSQKELVDEIAKVRLSAESEQAQRVLGKTSTMDVIVQEYVEGTASLVVQSKGVDPYPDAVCLQIIQGQGCGVSGDSSKIDLVWIDQDKIQEAFFQGDNYILSIETMKNIAQLTQELSLDWKEDLNLEIIVKRNVGTDIIHIVQVRPA